MPEPSGLSAGEGWFLGQTKMAALSAPCATAEHTARGFRTEDTYRRRRLKSTSRGSLIAGFSDPEVGAGWLDPEGLDWNPLRKWGEGLL